MFPFDDVITDDDICHISQIQYVVTDTELRTWASCQIRKIAGCACSGNTGNVSPPPTSKEIAIPACITARAWRTFWVRGARAVMHVGIAIPRWRRKRSRHSRRMHNPQFYVSGKRPIDKNITSFNFYDPCPIISLVMNKEAGMCQIKCNIWIKKDLPRNTW